MDRGITSKKALPPGMIARGFLQVGNDIVDCGASRIISRDPPVKITPKVLAVLLELARHQGETVARDTLLDTVWAETHPTPDVVKQAILEIRRAFGTSDESSEIVETIPRLGYRLLVSARFSDTLEGLAGVESDTAGDIPVHYSESIPETPGAPEKKESQLKYGIFLCSAIAIAAAAAYSFFANSGNPSLQTDSPAETRAPMHLNFRLLTSNLGMETMPSISPDGSRVAYVAVNRQDATSRIRIQTADGQGTTWLNENSLTQELYPVWSGDGASLAYISADEKGCSILAKPATGGDDRLLGHCWSRFVQLYDWSPDMKFLALSQFPTNSNPLGYMTEISLEKQSEDYFNYPKSLASSDYEPHYSPDGRFIAFRRGVQPVNDLFLFDRKKRTVRQLTDFGGSLKGFTWSPSGKRLIFSSNHEGMPALYVIEIASGKISPLGIEDAEYPSMARKTQSLVFAKTRITKRITEYSLDDSGKAGRPLFAGTTGSDQAAVLSEDNDFLAMISNRSGVEQVWLNDRKHPDKELFQLSSFNGERLSQICWLHDNGKLLVIASRGNESGLYSIDLARRTQILLSPKNLQVMQATYGDSENEIWLTAKQNGKTASLWRGELHDGQYKFSPMNLMATEVRWVSEGQRLLVNPNDRNEYRVYDRNLKLLKSYRLDLMPLFSRVRKNMLWYLGVAGNGFGLYRMPLDTGKSELVRDGLKAQWSYPWFDIYKDEKQALLTEIERDDTDIAITTLPAEIQ